MKLFELSYLERAKLLRFMRDYGMDIPGTLPLREINKIMQKFIDKNYDMVIKAIS